MLDIVDVKAVFLDHSYCKKTTLESEISSILDTELLKMADNTLDWEGIGIEFDPPSVVEDSPFSALSPSHSVDSGFDNEMNFLSDLDGLNLDMILNGDMNGNVSKVKEEHLKSNPSKRLPSSSTVTKTNTKVVEETSDVDKSRKNAIAARENRLKKKKYVEGIEKELDDLRRENEILKTKERRHNQVVEKLEGEVSYLKSVLANESTLSNLMNRLVSTPGIKFNLAGQSSTQLPGRNDNTAESPKQIPMDSPVDDANRDDDDDESKVNGGKGNVRRSVQTRYHTRGTKRSATTTEQSTTAVKKTRKEVNGGVCLHVGKDMVSLTFCSQCSRNINGNSGN